MRAGLSSGIEMAGKHATGKEDVIIATVQALNASRECGVCYGEECDEWIAFIESKLSKHGKKSYS